MARSRTKPSLSACPISSHSLTHSLTLSLPPSLSPSLSLSLPLPLSLSLTQGTPPACPDGLSGDLSRAGERGQLFAIDFEHVHAPGRQHLVRGEGRDLSG